MLFAAKHRKDRNFKLREDEVTSCILGPLSYMAPEDVWALFSGMATLQGENVAHRNSDWCGSVLLAELGE